MVKLIQPSMAGGEISASVGARVDLAKRSVAVKLAENYTAKFEGGMDSRPGQKYVCNAKPASGQYRLIPFEFNTEQTFIIELGDQYARLVNQGLQVLDDTLAVNITGATAANPVVITSVGHGFSTGDEVYIGAVGGMTELNTRNFLITVLTPDTFSLQDLQGVDIDGTGYTAYTSGGVAAPPYEVATPWLAEDLFDLNYAQSGDILTIVHPDYPATEVVRISNTNWTLSPIEFTPDTPYPTNMVAEEKTPPAGSSVAITGVTQANPAVVTATAHGLVENDIITIISVGGMGEINNFTYIVDQVLTAGTFVPAYRDTGFTVNSTGFGAYTSGGAVLKTPAQRRYTVTAVNRDDQEESLRGVAVGASSVTDVSSATTAVVTTAAGHGLNSFDLIEMAGLTGDIGTLLNGQRFQVLFLTATTFELYNLDGSAVDTSGVAAFSGTASFRALFANAPRSLSTDWNNTIRWTAVPEAAFYNVYASESGVFGYIGSTEQPFFNDRGAEPDLSRTPPRLYDPFKNGNNPGTTGFHDQRRIFANTADQPNRFFMTQAGHLSNFASATPLRDTDAIMATIAARQINEIRHILPLQDLMLLTSGGEYRVFSDVGVLTPTTINVKPQSYYGSTILRPIVAGSKAMFMSPGEFVRELDYDLARDKFAGRDLSILARHLFDRKRIVDWAYAAAPYGVVWCIRDDGIALSLTYQPDQDVYAWCRHTTRGKYKSVAVVREGETDVPYFVVERKINGVIVNFVERLDNREFDSLGDAFCVDAGLSLGGAITITGATAANPVVITAPAHGLQPGDTVDIWQILEETEENNVGEKLSPDYNGTGYVVGAVTTDTFELQNPDGVSYDGSSFAAYSSGGTARQAVTTVSGLWHLEGATVVAAANGYAIEGLVVQNGSVTLDDPASLLHIGLQYTCRLETLPLEIYADSGKTTVGQLKNVSRLSVQLDRSMGMWYGPDMEHMREAKFGLPELYGQPLDLVSDIIDVTTKGDWAKRRSVIIEQRSPLPMSILALVPDTLFGGN
jgi:hypothetical protein